MNERRDYQAKSKLRYLLLAGVLGLLLVFFGFFASLEEVGHDCDGDHCPVCAMLEIIQQNSAAGPEEAGTLGILGLVLIAYLRRPALVWESPVHSLQIQRTRSDR